MKQVATTALLAAMLAAPVTSWAQGTDQPAAISVTEESPWAFSLGVSTVGLTGQVAYQVNDQFRLRGILGGAPRIRGSENESGIQYDIDARIFGLSLLGDYFIGQSVFRITFGAFLSDSSIVGNASGLLTIGDDIYDTSIRAETKFARNIAPVLALGFDIPLGKNTSFVGSAGYVFTNGLTTDITVTAGDPVDPDDLETEEGQLKNSFGPGYPFIEFGLLFTF